MGEIQKVETIRTAHIVACDTIVETKGEITRQEWENFGLKLAAAEKFVQWYLGYWWNYGHKKWGRKAEGFVKKLGYERSTLATYGSIYNSIKPLTRVKDLTFKHHRLIAPMNGPEQVKWLKQAKDNKWTVAKLREAIIGKKDFEPKIYDIWNFQGIDDRFGQPHPGNIPAGIILNTLYYYTKEGDLVIDPMAGGGVTIDCCKYLKRKCLAYDTNPKRKDIIKNDVLAGYPPKAKGCDLIFLDPPYYKKKEEDYGEDSISALSEDDYWLAFTTIATNSYKCVKSDGFLALVMEPYIDYEDSAKSLWLFQYINIFTDNKWKVERIIDVPENSQRYQAFNVARAKENEQMLTLRRQLILFRR